MMQNEEEYFSDSQADTYIEKQFEIKCQRLKIGNDLLDEWREDKRYYCSFTETTMFDFQHYSMHDRSHSINILQNINMILGDERVNLLSVSDLWLLLESAYCHDIGMAVTYEELCDIWEQDEFEEFVKKSLISRSTDTRRIAYVYEKLSELVMSRSKFKKAAEDKEPDGFIEDFDNLLEHKSWPVAAQRYIMLLYTDFIRSKHPKRSRAFIHNYGQTKDRSRLYDIVAEIAMLHGEDFNQIFSMVEQKDNGFEGDHMHPQFAAAMIRLGDLLDMDSNRFNIRMLNHMGMIPEESQLHIRKHKAMTHLSYTEKGISATAKSEDFQVCKTVNQWFSWIEEETMNLICVWNLIVPEKLYGCRINRSKLKIYYKDELFDARKQTNFQADPVGIFDMLIGNNIYKTRLEFVREYLQNAMDASKMKLWLWLKEQKSLLKEHPPEEVTPFDISPTIYEQYKIEVELKINWEKQELLIAIQDHGIGMEEKCISSLSVVAGNHWKKREDYADEIEKMPVWLRPTGGFGIGIQSAFMVTDSVEFITKSENEPKGKRIVIESKRKGGRVSEYSYSDAKNGTRVEICVNLGIFLKEFQEKKEIFALDKEVGKNVYDPQENAKVLLDIMERYISDLAVYSLLPISLKCNNEVERKLGMKWMPEDYSVLDQCRRNGLYSVEVGNKNCLVQSYVYRDIMVIWNNTDYIMSIITLNGSINKCYYKGVLISNEISKTNEPFSIAMVYYWDDVADSLTVSRDSFIGDMRNKHHKKVYIMKMLYATLFIKNYEDFTDCQNRIKELKKVMTWHYLGVITSKKGMSGNKNKGYRALQSGNHGKLLVMYLDKKALFDLKKNSIGDVLQSAGADICVEDVEKIIFKSTFFREEMKDINEVLEGIKKEKKIYFSSADDVRRYEMDIKAFRGECLDILEKYDSADSRFSSKEDEMLWRLMNEEAYIILDWDVCDALLQYTENYEHNRSVSYLKIKENESLFLNIVCVENRKRFKKNNGLEIENLVKTVLKRALEGIKPVKFPMVLCDHGSWKEYNPEYSIWVTELFADRYQDLWEGGSEGNEKAANKKYDSHYLILPFTSRSWARIMQEMEDGGITDKKYSEIVKNSDELRLIYEWIYHYQADKGERLSLRQIQEAYDKFVDDIYKWIFGKNE